MSLYGTEILGSIYVHNLVHLYPYFVYNYIYLYVCVDTHLALKTQIIYKTKKKLVVTLPHPFHQLQWQPFLTLSQVFWLLFPFFQ